MLSMSQVRRNAIMETKPDALNARYKMDTSVQIVLALVQSAHQKWLSLIAETGYFSLY